MGRHGGGSRSRSRRRRLGTPGRASSTVRRSPAATALHAAALCALVGGTTAFISLDKTVTLSVDGHRYQVRSFGRTVDDVLEREGVRVSEHDTVAPSLGTEVEEGTRIAVRHGRMLTLTVDDATRQVWVTASDVDEALDQLGIRAADAYLSASRSRRIPSDGLALELRTEREVVVLADNRRRVVTTTAGTVRQALADAGLRLGGQDKVSTPLQSFPLEGQVVRVTRIDDKRVVDNVDIPFETEERETDELYEGEENVLSRGRPGLVVKVYDVTVVDGKATSRRLVSSRQVEKPVRQVVEVGTKERPAGSAPPEVAELNWAALAECESGGDPDAYNPSGPYYGLYQFSESTWASVGGSGVPTDASADEQTHRAQLLYQRSGAGQWPECGSQLYS